MVLDETSCRPLPVTVDYLWHRVPNMTRPAAQVIVTALQEAHHLESYPSLSSFLTSRSYTFQLARGVTEKTATIRRFIDYRAATTTTYIQTVMIVMEYF